MTGPWHAVDGTGHDLVTGRRPVAPGWPSPAAAVAAAPVAAWPLRAADGTRTVDLAGALGPGGDGVAALLDALMAHPDELDVDALARATPAGRVDLPLAVTGLREGAEAAATVDPVWLAAVARARDACRGALLDAGREAELEAALHVTVLLATERLDPADDADVDAHAASGAQLWLLTGAVASALAGVNPDPFRPWGRLVAAGWWPVGPCEGRLVVAR